MRRDLPDLWGRQNKPVLLLVVGTVGIWIAAQLPMALAIYMRDEPSLLLADAAVVVAAPALGLLVSALQVGAGQRRLFAVATALFSLAIAGIAVPQWAVVLRARAADGSAIQAFVAHDPHLLVSVLVGVGCLALLGQRAFGGAEVFTRARSAALGDAMWLSMPEASKLFPPDGEVVIGEAYRPDLERRGHQPFDPGDIRTWGSGGSAALLTYKLNFDSTHMLFFAGSGGYKTTSTVVPTALRYQGSMVVLDPAREVGQLVGAYRSQMPVAPTSDAKKTAVGMTRTVKLLDPTQSDVDGCDVLEPIRNSSSLLTDAVAFARLLTAESPKRSGGSEQYFEQQALNLMTGLLVYVLASREFETTRRLDDLRTLASLTETALKAKIASVVTGPTSADDAEFIEDETYRRFLKETLGPYVKMADQTFTGVASSVAKDTQWLSIPALRAMVCGRSFKVSDLPKGELDIFIQMPGDLMKSYPGVCRTLIGAFMKAMEKAEGNYAKRVLFVLDEVDLLGYMSILEEARDRGRKYGITLMMMYQSVGQLEKHFGKEGATSWFEGAAFASYAAIKSRETAEHLSKQIGDVTVEVEGRSTSTSWMDGLLSKNAHQSARLTNSVSLQKRAFLMPHEIREMRADEQIILVRGYPALRTGRAIYFRRPDMAARTGTTAFAKRA